MRKRSINNLFDNLMWYLIYMLPLICSFYCMSSYFTNLDNFLSIIVNNDNVIYTTLNSIFGSNSEFFTFLNNDTLIKFFTYFIICNIIHFIVDVILYIIRWSHNLLNRSLKQ